jgi:hypothetical protein
MPWDKFDSAILWTPDAFNCWTRGSTSTDVFPTWSWISSMGPVTFGMGCEPVYSLVCWGISTGAATASRPLRWSTLEPSYPHTMNSDPYNLDKTRPERYIVAALSWLHGCVQKAVPLWLLVDCECDDYVARLKGRWSKPTLPFWREAFQSYGKIFDKIDNAYLSEAGCLMAHTQTAAGLFTGLKRPTSTTRQRRTRTRTPLRHHS